MDFRLPPSDYTESANSSYPMHEGYDQYGTNQYGNFSGVPPVGEQIPPVPPPPRVQWNQFQSAPPPPPPPPNDPSKTEALVTEMLNHRASLNQQREGYLAKISTLKKELETLKKQKNSMKGDSRRTPSPNALRILNENDKLQNEISKRLKSFYDVVDMLNGLIGDNPKEKSKKRKSRKKRSSSESGDSSQDSDSEKHSRHKRHKKRSESSTAESKYNLVFYDPEMHWCPLCNVFPKTAKDYLNHLHTPQHYKGAAEHVEAPWHDVPNENEGMPSFPGAPSKRTPIKGLQFFVPASAWFCKLCEKWIGDLHCASSHLKSKLHVENYAKFVESNPHWETDWITDRSKNYEKEYRDTIKDSADPPKVERAYSPHKIAFEDGYPIKIKKSQAQPEENTIPLKLSTPKNKKEKKKKKGKKKRRSSSMSTDSSDSSSNSDADTKNKKEKEKEKDVNGQQKPWKEEEPLNDTAVNQWMAVGEPQLGEQDKQILEKLKNSVKNKAVEKTEPQVDERVVSREREARELLLMRNEALKSLPKYNSKERDEKDRGDKRDKERDRDRDREREKERERDDRRRGHRERSRDRYDSNSRRHSRKDSQERDKQNDKNRKDSKSSGSSDSKKMPIIGKMPLYKTLKSKQEDASKEAEQKRQEELNAMNQRMMPDYRHARQFPPPGIAFPMPYGATVDIHHMLSNLNAQTFPQTIHRVQKSPIKVIPNSAKKAKTLTLTVAPDLPEKIEKPKNNLQKDLKEAPPPPANAPAAPPPPEQVKQPTPPPEQEQDTTTIPMSSYYQSSDMAAQGYDPSYMMMYGYDYYGQQGMYDMSQQGMTGYENQEGAEANPEPADSGRPELEDLAMLGIDAEDVGAGGF